MRRFVLALLFVLPATAAAQPAAEAKAEEAQIRAGDARFEAGAFLGIRGWKTAYRKTDTLFTYGAFGAWMPIEWVGLVGSVEHARRSSASDLQIRNTETLFAVGPRLSLWLDMLRFFLDVHGTGTLRTVKYLDVDDVSNTRFSVGVSVGPGFTVAVADRLGVTVRLDWRRRDDQSHMIGTLDVSWLFQ